MILPDSDDIKGIHAFVRGYKPGSYDPDSGPSTRRETLDDLRYELFFATRAARFQVRFAGQVHEDTVVKLYRELLPQLRKFADAEA